MKILLSSYVFSPSVGGIETVSALLAAEFIKAGHEVTLITTTPQEDGIDRPYAVYRNPSPSKLIELMRWCDVFFQSNVSLRLAWPLLLVRRPWVVVHHMWLGHPLHPTWNPWATLKRLLLHSAHNVAISRAIADAINVPSVIIGNPYSDILFRNRPEVACEGELAYLGRLVSDKGVDLLIEALAQLRERGLTPQLTIIGSGPEGAALGDLAVRRGLDEQIKFTGSKEGEELSRLLNAHRILVIPSRLPEPFGIVALEAIASGCIIVASDGGGLPDAVGPCGVIFPIGDKAALTEMLSTVLTRPDLREQLARGAEHHLTRFKPAFVAARYLEVFEKAIESSA